MAKPRIQLVIGAEAVAAMVTAGGILFESGRMAAAIGLPLENAEMAMMRTLMVLLVAFGGLLWATRRAVASSAGALAGLAITHGFAALILLGQELAIWTNAVGLEIALIPLALTIGYGIVAWRLGSVPTAPPAAAAH